MDADWLRNVPAHRPLRILPTVRERVLDQVRIDNAASGHRAGWQVIREINSSVNAAIAPITDEDLYGKDEVWAYPRTLAIVKTTRCSSVAR